MCVCAPVSMNYSVDNYCQELKAFKVILEKENGVSHVKILCGETQNKKNNSALDCCPLAVLTVWLPDTLPKNTRVSFYLIKPNHTLTLEDIGSKRADVVLVSPHAIPACFSLGKDNELTPVVAVNAHEIGIKIDLE